jgi:hypothetical protein
VRSAHALPVHQSVARLTKEVFQDFDYLAQTRSLDTNMVHRARSQSNFGFGTLMARGAVSAGNQKPRSILFMSKQEEAGLILRLYELRRDETMRKARDWYFREFNPESLADFNSAIFGDQSGYMRMVISYWDMAAALVNNGAISLELFNDSNGEHIGVFSKIEPLLGEIRAAYGPQFAANFEKLIDASPDGRSRVAAARAQMKAIRAQLAVKQAKAASA